MSMQSLFTSLPLRAAMALVSATTAVFFAGVYAAHAWPGRSGEARSTFTVAGSLVLPAGATRPPMLRFVFHKTGAPDCSLDTRADMGTTGDQFTAQIDYDACGRAFFDGSDVTADVLVNGAAVITGQPVNPVPYAHFASVAGIANQYGTPDCPVGYDLATDPTFTGDKRLCFKHPVPLVSGAQIYDWVVRVGTGASAFWIDRYEASVWENSDGTGTQYGDTSDDYPSSFPKTGLWSTAPLYARSKVTTRPSRFLSWFQANEACRASGKRLARGDEWLAAARGTPDPGSSEVDGSCRTAAGPRGAAPRSAEFGSLCLSGWGAQDMIGNLREWTADWAVSPPVHIRGSVTGGGGTVNIEAGLGSAFNPWPAVSGFRRDDVVGSPQYASATGGPPQVDGAPTAIVRGGDWQDGEGAGIQSMLLDTAPSGSSASIGFRCVIPR